MKSHALISLLLSKNVGGLKRESSYTVTRRTKLQNGKMYTMDPLLKNDLTRYMEAKFVMVRINQVGQPTFSVTV